MVKSNIYYENMCFSICKLSINNTSFIDASKEWIVINHFTLNGQECLCGKMDISDIYSIQNILNGNIVEYIGSSCIKLFKNHFMNNGMKIIKYGEMVLKNGKCKGLTFLQVCNSNESYIKYLETVYLDKAEFKKLCIYYKYWLTTKKPNLQKQNSDPVSIGDFFNIKNKM